MAKVFEYDVIGL